MRYVSEIIINYRIAKRDGKSEIEIQNLMKKMYEVDIKEDETHWIISFPSPVPMDRVESHLKRCSEWGECNFYRSSDREYIAVLPISNPFPENEKDIVTLASVQGFSIQKNAIALSKLAWDNAYIVNISDYRKLIEVFDDIVKIVIGSYKKTI